MFWWRCAVPADAGPHGAVGLDLAFTDTHGGRTHAPYGELDLARHDGADDELVLANRAALAHELGLSPGRLAFMSQQHGTTVAVVRDPQAYPAPEADAMLTDVPDLGLAVLVADCTPVLLADRVAGIAGVVHAGRPGALAGIVPAALAAMRDLGAKRIEATVGPSICGRCYEVPAPMRDAAAARSAVAATVSWTGTPAIDVAAVVVGQLTAQDVRITWVAGCTREEPRLYSYRGQGVTGRFAGIVRLRRSTAPR